MTVNRILILLVVLVGVLYGIILALGSRNHGKPPDPNADWLTNLAPSQEFNLDEVTATNGWQNGKWTIAKGVREAGLEIEPSESGQVIRRVAISLKGSSSFELEFTPRTEPGQPEKYIDAQASSVTVEDLTQDREPVELTILEHGGSLVARRDDVGSPAILTLESAR